MMMTLEQLHSQTAYGIWSARECLRTTAPSGLALDAPSNGTAEGLVDSKTA